MATKRQISANQQNAKRSTGPKTAGGKKISSSNAQKTGIYAKGVVLPDEDERTFGQLRSQVYQEWQPMGPTEKFYAEQLVGLMWRKARLFRVEADLIMMRRRRPSGIGGIATALDMDSKKYRALDRLLRHEAFSDRSIDRTIDKLRQLQETRNERSGLAHFLTEESVANVVPALPPATT